MVDYGNLDEFEKYLKGIIELRGLCKKEGHMSFRGTVSRKSGKLFVFDKCKRCRTFYIRNPISKESKRYELLIKQF